MSKIYFTDEQLEEMQEMHNNGCLHRDIAEYFNVSRGTIDRRLREMNVVSRHPRLTEEREKQAIVLYNKYHRINQVAQELHMSNVTVSNILKAHNIYIMSQTEIKVSHLYDFHYFDDINSTHKAYFLGLLSADGSVGKNDTRIQISLQEQDDYIIERLKDEIGYKGKLQYLEYSKKNVNWSNQVMLSISNKCLHDGLIAHGVVPNKSHLLTFPTNLNPSYYSHYCRGILDGDGCIAKKECRVKITSTLSFCESLKRILEDTLNIHCSIMLCHNNSESVTRDLQIAGHNQVKKFLDWIYIDADIYLVRKYDIYQDVYCKCA